MTECPDPRADKHNELQYYVPDEVYVENGWLRMRSRVRNYGGVHFTSGRLDTSGKFAPTYGRFEIRARLPGGKGLWPAHWLTRSSGNRTRCVGTPTISSHTTVNSIPRTPHYSILNTAVGGGWPGNPDATTVFPQYHDIDYVPVYQRADF